MKKPRAKTRGKSVQPQSSAAKPVADACEPTQPAVPAYFLPRPFFTLSASRRSFPALKRTFFDAGMVIFSFVRGLRPSRALRADTAKLPSPGIEQRSPR